MAIIIDIEGEKFSNFTTINVMRNIEQLSGSFSFTASSDLVKDFPVKRNSNCKIYIDKTLIFTGIIERVGGYYGADQHDLYLSGRDKARDIVDSTIINNIEFKNKISLKSVITKSLETQGITGFTVINEAGDIADFEKNELVSGSIGENLFSFIESYCRKRQVLIGSNELGELVLRRGGSTNTNIKLINNKKSNDNNILTIHFDYDDSQRFGQIKVVSQGNPSIDNKTTDKKKLTDINQVATDSEVSATRKYGLIAETSIDLKNCKKRAEWEVNLRRARALTYSVDVYGHYYGDNKDIWKINTLVDVDDDFADIQSSMLIKEVNFKYGEYEGSKTNLVLVSPESYKIQGEIDQLSSKTSKIGSNLK